MCICVRVCRRVNLYVWLHRDACSLKMQKYIFMIIIFHPWKEIRTWPQWNNHWRASVTLHEASDNMSSTWTLRALFQEQVKNILWVQSEYWVVIYITVWWPDTVSSWMRFVFHFQERVADGSMRGCDWWLIQDKTFLHFWTLQYTSSGPPHLFDKAMWGTALEPHEANTCMCMQWNINKQLM